MQHVTLPQELRHEAKDRTSHDIFRVYGEFPGGLKREAGYLSGPEVLTKLIEYRLAGAIKRGYVCMPKRFKTVWGGYDKYS